VAQAPGEHGFPFDLLSLLQDLITPVVGDAGQRQFDTNVIGLLEVTKAVLPHMRAHRSGTIVNISSIGGQGIFPLGTLYHGTKFLVPGLSEALHDELEPLGTRVRIVEPGMIKTDFGGRSFDFAMHETLSD